YYDLLCAQASTQCLSKDYEGGIATSEKLLDKTKSIMSTHDIDVRISALFNIGKCKLGMNDPDAAEANISEGLKLAESAFGATSGPIAEGNELLADIEVYRHNVPKALTHIERSISCYELNISRFEAPLFELFVHKATLLIKLNDKAKVADFY